MSKTHFMHLVLQFAPDSPCISGSVVLLCVSPCITGCFVPLCLCLTSYFWFCCCFMFVSHLALLVLLLLYVCVSHCTSDSVVSLSVSHLVLLVLLFLCVCVSLCTSGSVCSSVSVSHLVLLVLLFLCSLCLTLYFWFCCFSVYDPLCTPGSVSQCLILYFSFFPVLVSRLVLLVLLFLYIYS